MGSGSVDSSWRLPQITVPLGWPWLMKLLGIGQEGQVGLVGLGVGVGVGLGFWVEDDFFVEDGLGDGVGEGLGVEDTGGYVGGTMAELVPFDGTMGFELTGVGHGTGVGVGSGLGEGVGVGVTGPGPSQLIQPDGVPKLI